MFKGSFLGCFPIQRAQVDHYNLFRSAETISRLAEQVHLQTLLEIRDPALQKLFRTLSTQDGEHRRRLEMILQSL
jgi:rubrerythrin